ncbi:molybdenum cofactor guanylyltransferase [Pseudalkalibacillus caeni]|nr:molybdenum cofactor guanylyltransferase [Pseudalkalibacillus caeni]
MITGVILAGGKKDFINGTRKSFLQLNDRTVLDYQLKELGKVSREVMIVTDDPRAFLPNVPPTVRIITDFYKNIGVFGGMHAAFSLAKAPYIWLAGSGMPFISSSAAEYMVNQLGSERYEGAIPVIDGNPYPLHGIYTQKALLSLNQLIKKGDFSMASFLKKITWLPIRDWPEDISKKFVFSIQTKADYETAKSEISTNKISLLG